ncbi:TPA: hypothetical protein DEP21_03450 [Patescibacteria group bacterium]|nr:hypothetical protein [Candidatus Gracilibacteria bacterium]
MENQYEITNDQQVELEKIQHEIMQVIFLADVLLKQVLYLEVARPFLLEDFILDQEFLLGKQHIYQMLVKLLIPTMKLVKVKLNAYHSLQKLELIINSITMQNILKVFISPKMYLFQL